MEDHNRIVGRSGEDEAELYFRDMGFDIVARNFRYGRSGEIDLIASKEGLLLFVEVKKRSSQAYGGALFSINRRKALTLKKTAAYFLSQNPRFNQKKITCRFDLLALEDGDVSWHRDIIR